MPPKPKFTREEIICAAYALMERGGMEAVVAREVGRELGVTVAPIFTCFANMEELKAAVHAKAIQECAAYFRDFSDYFPAFKEFGLRWMRLAQEHPHVYREIFLRREPGGAGEPFNAELWQMMAPVRAEIVRTFGLAEADAEQLLRDMLVYCHGMAALLAGGQVSVSEEELRVGLSRICLSLAAGCQARDGAENPRLTMMFRHLDLIPRKKSEMEIPFQ